MKAITKPSSRVVEELVRRHQATVRGFLVFLDCPRAMLDDLVQDVFLSVLGSGFEQRGPAASAAFLRTVARNLFLKAMRRARKEPPIADLAGAEAAWLDFEREDGGESYLEALRDCLRRLKGRASEILRLRYEVSMQRAAIAGRLGMTESGVKSVLVRTRRKLRGCVERSLQP